MIRIYEKNISPYNKASDIYGVAILRKYNSGKKHTGQSNEFKQNWTGLKTLTLLLCNFWLP